MLHSTFSLPEVLLSGTESAKNKQNPLLGKDGEELENLLQGENYVWNDYKGKEEPSRKLVLQESSHEAFDMFILLQKMDSTARDVLAVPLGLVFLLFLSLHASHLTLARSEKSLSSRYTCCSYHHLQSVSVSFGRGADNDTHSNKPATLIIKPLLFALVERT